MDKQETALLLEAVEQHRITPEAALQKLKQAPFVDLQYAKIDLHRGLRQGVPEVIYGAGKNAEQIIGIACAMLQNGQDRILITRIDAEKAEAIAAALPLHYHEAGKIGMIGEMPEPNGIGTVLIVTGGTSDQSVAEEAAFTAEVLGNRVQRLYDVGVSGLHRLLAHIDEIMSASVIIAAAGMEGALASVGGGLADCPVIAVPTSVGYGASFGGITALLSMLNSCASGVSVVNIDNGFGAAYQASMINHIGGKNANALS